MTNKPLPCSVTIGVARCSSTDDHYVVRVSDVASGIQVLEIELSLTAFAQALGSSEVKGVAHWRGLDRVGWTNENKTVHGVTAENLHSFEVDGWTAREGDLGNCHCREQGGYRVVFFRHLSPTEGDSDA